MCFLCQLWCDSLCLGVNGTNTSWLTWVTNASGIHLKDLGTALILFSNVCECVWCFPHPYVSVHFFHNYSDICWLCVKLALITVLMVLMASGVIGWSDWCEVLGFLCCSARLLSNPLSSKTCYFIWMFHLHSELKWCGYLKPTTAIHWKQNFPWSESHFVSKSYIFFEMKNIVNITELDF